jgi:hypothetical protein
MSAPITSRFRSMLQRAAKPREVAEEKRFVKLARDLGWITRKMNGGGYRDWADQLVLLPYGVTVLAEFKRGREVMRETQAELASTIVHMGHRVVLVYTAEQAIALCEEAIMIERTRP